MDSNGKLDEAFLPFSEFIEELSDLEGKLIDSEGDEVINMEIERVDMQLPMQIDLTVDENGNVSIGGVPPLYYVETTFMPVFHQLSLRLEPAKHNDGKK